MNNIDEGLGVNMWREKNVSHATL